MRSSGLLFSLLLHGVVVAFALFWTPSTVTVSLDTAYRVDLVTLAPPPAAR